MNRLFMIGAIAAFAAVAAGCNNPDPPDKVQRDVSNAQRERSADVADARRQGTKEVDAQRRDVADASANKDYDVAVAKAKGDYEVATKACNALAGSAQADCKDRADATYDADKKRAEQLKLRR